MKQTIGLLLTLALFAAVPGDAQCTAGKAGNEAARIAVKSIEGAAWPLPVPSAVEVQGYDDLVGALLIAGETVYQVEHLAWQITPEGHLDVVEFMGYTSDGIATTVVRAENGVRVTDFSQLNGFYLGDPDGSGSPAILVDSIQYGINLDGFVTVVQLIGTAVGSGSGIAFAGSVETRCGVHVAQGCNANNCSGACGNSPACPCTGANATGACSGEQHTACYGTCDDGLICMGGASDCGCKPPPKDKAAAL